MTGSLSHFQRSLAKVGWFIPPFVTMRTLKVITGAIDDTSRNFSETDLEVIMSEIYVAEHLAALVVDRYPVIPVIKDYRFAIAEAIESHFLGLHHVAVSGLAPVVEGAARQLASNKGLDGEAYIKVVLRTLSDACSDQCRREKIGAWEEVASMMDAFAAWSKEIFYTSSSSYPLGDNTNRHGILHGAFTDSKYGRPINFYKVISAVDMLMMIASLQSPDESFSWLAPSETIMSRKLSLYYGRLAETAATRP